METSPLPSCVVYRPLRLPIIRTTHVLGHQNQRRSRVHNRLPLTLANPGIFRPPPTANPAVSNCQNLSDTFTSTHAISPLNLSGSTLPNSYAPTFPPDRRSAVNTGAASVGIRFSKNVFSPSGCTVFQLGKCQPQDAPRSGRP